MLTTRARAALMVAAGALMLLGVSGPLYQLGLLSLEAAYAGVRVAAVVAGIVAVLAAALGWAATRRGARVARLTSVAALAIALFTVIVPVRESLRRRAAPPLHDVTTDLEHPPVFTALLDVQAAASRLPRPPRIDALQAEAFPDIRPLLLPVPRDMAFEEVLETLSELEWPIADGSEEEGRVEATARSPWFGFKDDIVIRLTAIDDQTRVDVRSVSRDAVDDGGRNAAHVREFLEELRR